MITTTFHYFFLSSCAHSHLKTLSSQALIELQELLTTVNQTGTHHKMTSMLFVKRTCVPRFPNMINYIFSTHLQFSHPWKSFGEDSESV